MLRICFSENVGVQADDFPIEYIQMVFSHMSPLIQNTMRTPTEVSRTVMLTGIPIGKFFKLQWLPNSDDFLHTTAGMTATANNRAARGTGSTSRTFLWLQSSQRLLFGIRKFPNIKLLFFLGRGISCEFSPGKTNLGQKLFPFQLYF